MRNPTLIQQLAEQPFVRIHATEIEPRILERILLAIGVDCFIFRQQFLITERSIDSAVSRLAAETPKSPETASAMRALKEGCDRTHIYYRLPAIVDGSVSGEDLATLGRGHRVNFSVIGLPGTRIERLHLVQRIQFQFQLDGVHIKKLQLMTGGQTLDFRSCTVEFLVANVDLDWGGGNRVGLLSLEKGVKVSAGVYQLILLNQAHLDDAALQFGRGVAIDFSDRILQEWYWPYAPLGRVKRLLTPFAMHLHFRGVLVPGFIMRLKFFSGTRMLGWRREVGAENRPDLISDDHVRAFSNTYAALLARRSLNAHSMALERYLSFFRSRQHWQQRFLYAIHGGYYRLLRPLIVSLAMLAMQVMLLQAAGPLPEAGVGELIVNPAKLWGVFVLRDLGASVWVDWSKIGVACANVAMLYFGFAFAVAVKRRFGFPRESA